MDAKQAIELLHKDTYHLTNEQAKAIATMLESLARDAAIGKEAIKLTLNCIYFSEYPTHCDGCIVNNICRIRAGKEAGE